MDTPSNIVDLEEGYAVLQWNRYNLVAGSAMLFYEHLITIDREARCICARKLSPGKALFFLLRYTTLILALGMFASGILAPTKFRQVYDMMIELPSD
ncbi:hypothetical protein C8Q76DRAFT_104343 [Earliella scabrosa]|nr:hypothetical protein C8Q76DRAFT_104343 [Earliella scabrosa]